MNIKIFQFNPFQENTYILYGPTLECVIIDPGCHNHKERQMLVDYIANQKLKPVRLLNTHCHIDHILGNCFIATHYGLELSIGSMELGVLNAAAQSAMTLGIDYAPSPEPKIYLDEGDDITFSEIKLTVIHVPGHSPGHLAFIDHINHLVIGGDVLFRGSIGRTDLPGGDYSTLINSIQQKLLPLGDDYRVFTGHGPVTTIGHEKKTNPFLISI